MSDQCINTNSAQTRGLHFIPVPIYDLDDWNKRTLDVSIHKHEDVSSRIDSGSCCPVSFTFFNTNTGESTLSCQMMTSAKRLITLIFVYPANCRYYYFWPFESDMTALKMSERERKYYLEFRVAWYLALGLTITRSSRQVEFTSQRIQTRKLTSSPSGDDLKPECTYPMLYTPQQQPFRPKRVSACRIPEDRRLTPLSRHLSTANPTRVSASPRPAPPSKAPLPATQPHRHSSRQHYCWARTTTPRARWPWPWRCRSRHPHQSTTTHQRR